MSFSIATEEGMYFSVFYPKIINCQSNSSGIVVEKLLWKIYSGTLYFKLYMLLATLLSSPA